MLLSNKCVAEIESGEPSFIPPHPERRKGYVHPVRRYKLFKKNMISAFDTSDYCRSYARVNILGKELILCNSPELVRESFQNQHETFQQKTSQMIQALKPLIGDGLFISDGDLWRERRAMVAPIIHSTKVKDFAPTMSETARDWADQWANKEDGSEIDVVFEMAELTAEIISRTIFGKKLGRNYTSEIVDGFKHYQSCIDQTDVLMHALNAPDWIPRLGGLKVRKHAARVHQVVDKLVDEVYLNSQDQTANDAMIGHLFNEHPKNGTRLSKQAVRNEAIVIFMAGHETTANTLAWAWLNISQSKRVREKLWAELTKVLGGRAPENEDVPELTYTSYILKETLRLYPPVPMLGRRALESGKFQGERFKKGCNLLVSPWLLHRNPKVWSKPDSFIPERFDPSIAPKPHKYAYIPFAIGPRICPGMTFGMTESVLALATLAQRFHLELVENHKVEAICRLTLRPGDKLPMKLVHR